MRLAIPSCNRTGSEILYKGCHRKVKLGCPVHLSLYPRSQSCDAGSWSEHAYFNKLHNQLEIYFTSQTYIGIA